MLREVSADGGTERARFGEIDLVLGDRLQRGVRWDEREFRDVIAVAKAICERRRSPPPSTLHHGNDPSRRDPRERLADREYIAGAYSIADVATWPWMMGVARALPELPTRMPNVHRWMEAVGARPAVKKGFALGT